MSLPTDPRSKLPPDPHADLHADLLVASAVRAGVDAPAADCPDAELLALYAERGLAGSDLALVETHLDGCPRCQAIVAACVRALPDAAAVPAGAFDPGANVRSWFAGWRWLVPITSVAAVAMVAVWIGRGPAEQVAEQTRSDALARPVSSAAPSAPTEPVSQLRRPDGARGTSAQAQPQVQASSPRAEATAKAETDRQAAGALTESAGAAGRPAGAGASATAAASRQAQRTDTFAAAAPPSATDQRRRTRNEEAREKATAAESARDAAQLADAAAAPAPPSPALAAVVPAPAPAATAARATNAVGGAMARDTVMATLTGTVTYRARVALPPGAVIDVRLLDVSRADPSASLRADAPADTVARAEIVTRGEQVPVAFSLSYDLNVIQARRRYIVQATIAIEGRLAWRTTTQHPVFVDGVAPTSPVTVIVEPIR